MRNKNGTVSRRWLEKMFRKYIHYYDGKSNYVIALLDENYDSDFYKGRQFIGSCMTISRREVKDAISEDPDMFSDFEYIYEKAELTFDQWHTGIPEKLLKKIMKLKLLLVTSKLKCIKANPTIGCIRYKFEFDNRKIVDIAKYVWDELLRSDKSIYNAYHSLQGYDYGLNNNDVK